MAVLQVSTHHSLLVRNRSVLDENLLVLLTVTTVVEVDGLLRNVLHRLHELLLMDGGCEVVGLLGLRRAVSCRTTVVCRGRDAESLAKGFRVFRLMVAAVVESVCASLCHRGRLVLKLERALA